MVSATQHDSSFQFPAPLSTPVLFRAGTLRGTEKGEDAAGGGGVGVGKKATFSPYCTVEPKTGKLIVSEVIFVIMISMKAYCHFKKSDFSKTSVVHFVSQQYFVSSSSSSSFQLMLLVCCSFSTDGNRQRRVVDA